MCVGHSYETTIPPHQGYGEKGVEGYIPSSAVMHIDLTIKEWWPEMDAHLVADCETEPTFSDCDKVRFQLHFQILILRFKDEDHRVTLEEFSSCLADCRIQGEPWVTNSEAAAEMFEELDNDENKQLDIIEFTMRLPEDHDEL